MGENARVFISCGQRNYVPYQTINHHHLKYTTPEFTIAKEIAEELEKLGYEAYLALEQQELQGVKEAIFKRLENVEYFLFVDFIRERLYDESLNILSEVHRGSLFSNQELAIATFLGYEVLAFQEEGVKKEDGILKFIKTNCKTFSDRNNLVKAVVAEVQEKWNPHWRNELVMEPDVGFVDRVFNPVEGKIGKYFHIRVTNKHKDRVARNCIAYVERIKNHETGEMRVLEFVELKWKGVKTVGVSIPAKSQRYLDAFHVNHEKPNTAVLGLNIHITDFTGYTDEYQISGAGDHQIDYVIFSDNFTPVRASFILHLGSKVEDTTITKV